MAVDIFIIMFYRAHSLSVSQVWSNPGTTATLQKSDSLDPLSPAEEEDKVVKSTSSFDYRVNLFTTEVRFSELWSNLL